jgi:hypothetical protein
MENKTSLNVSKHSYVRDVLLWKTHWIHVPTPFGKYPFAETISAERSFSKPFAECICHSATSRFPVVIDEPMSCYNKQFSMTD